MISPQSSAARFVKSDMALVPIDYEGVRCMSYGYVQRVAFDPGNDGRERATVVRGSMVAQLVEQLVVGTAWGKLDVLIVDMPPGTGDAQLALAASLPLAAAVVVTTPQKLAVVDVEKGVEMLAAMGVKTACLVENMAYFVAPDTGKKYFPFGPGLGDRLAAKIRLSDRVSVGEGEVSGSLPARDCDDANDAFASFQLPICAELCRACDEGTPFVLAAPDAEASKAYLDIARHVQTFLKNHGSGARAEPPRRGVLPKRQHWPTLLDMVRVSYYA
jgi:Mrp family chromosome partitioning ATPase